MVINYLVLRSLLRREMEEDVTRRMRQRFGIVLRVQFAIIKTCSAVGRGLDTGSQFAVDDFIVGTHY